MASCDRLGEIADKARAELTALNSYRNVSGQIYGPTHPNATQEVGQGDPSNIRGKGTGVAFDTENGGGYYDINGRPDVSGSGRKSHFTNTYNKNNVYDCVIDLDLGFNTANV
jgi:hypothetical protein